MLFSIIFYLENRAVY